MIPCWLLAFYKYVKARPFYGYLGNILKLLLYIFSKYNLYISLGKIPYCSLPIYSKVSCNAWTKRKTTMFFVIILYTSTISIRSLRGKNCGTLHSLFTVWTRSQSLKNQKKSFKPGHFYAKLSIKIDTPLGY